MKATHIVLFTVVFGAGLVAGPAVVPEDGAVPSFTRQARAGQPEPPRPEAPPPHAGPPTEAVPSAEGPEARDLVGLVIGGVVDIRAPLAGRVQEVAVSAGQALSPGQVVVRLEETQAQLAQEHQAARVSASRRDVAEATSVYQQALDEVALNRRLWANRAVSRSVLDSSKSQAQAYAARVAGLQEKLRGEEALERQLLHKRGLHVVHAACPGRVAEVVHPAGAEVQQGEVLLRVEQGAREVLVRLPPEGAGHDHLAFSTDVGGSRRPLELVRVRQGVQADGSHILVLRPPPDAALEAGQTLTVRAEVKEGR